MGSRARRAWVVAVLTALVALAAQRRSAATPINSALNVLTWASPGDLLDGTFSFVQLPKQPGDAGTAVLSEAPEELDARRAPEWAEAVAVSRALLNGLRLDPASAERVELLSWEPAPGDEEAGPLAALLTRGRAFTSAAAYPGADPLLPLFFVPVSAVEPVDLHVPKRSRAIDFPPRKLYPPPEPVAPVSGLSGSSINDEAARP